MKVSSIIISLYILSFNFVYAEKTLDVNNEKMLRAFCITFVDEVSYKATLYVYKTSYCEVAKHYNDIHCGDDKLSMMVYSDVIKDSLVTAIDNYIEIADCDGLNERDRKWFIKQYERTGIDTYKDLLEFWEE